jgi:O-antigen/teichoic acid export membrane protein
MGDPGLKGRGDSTSKGGGHLQLPQEEEEAAAVTRSRIARAQIRGSSMLLSGKVVAVGAKFIAQILVVRYLSLSDYGAWAYALAAVSFLGGFAHLSLDKAVARFAAIYHEREDYERFFGVMVLVVATVTLTGAVFVVGLYAAPDLFAGLIGGEMAPLLLLFILIFLVPLEALDTLLIAIFATFGRPRAILLRRYVITPLVQLTVVGLLILFRADIYFLAYGYLAGTLLGVLVSVWLLHRILREQGLLEKLRLGGIRVPMREMVSFSVPLMTSDWVTALTHSSGALVLGYFYATDEVAFFRVVMPVAVLNQLVIKSFHLLYVPSASRLFARSDHTGINELYWQTTLWIAVLTFPIFALTFAAATPLTVLFFGARYEASGLILAILVLGQYAQASLGFNGSTIKVIGKVNHLVVINLAAAVVNVILMFMLIPPLGAVGAAVAMSATMVVHNLFKQIGLRVAGGFTFFDRRYVPSFGIVAMGAAALVILRLSGVTSPLAQVSAALFVSFLVLLLSRRMLRIGEVFPELVRVPFLRVILT